MSRFILVTKETYPLLMSGFLGGADELSADPNTGRRDRRPGNTGGEIAREERAIKRAILELGVERDLNDNELSEYSDSFKAREGHAPTIKDIEKLGKVTELKNDPCYLELNENLWERLKEYFNHAKWYVRSADMGANLLDLVENAPKEKPLNLENLNAVNKQ